ncbi:hypothetical protein BBO99_00003708 [Phytophthora kernoviae]|uniref:N(6)-adenine-specific DNA methyltransferase 2 n=2 Tax=Phytophthora kernoviae TaxID=325452 RepID=A0A421GUB0_9STRA|nr:hypothetical protein G195_005236 [Phytophthora kernoviae 00238/432]KAG2523862.1 hypothetical protein JM16_003213 [Phytophthora kernoviae]KAG2525682.1 hypothetical protein JM18_003083 [Phytophthora kernoviae]RLN02587.1 hypothetical protein BBI17_003432 [Phytophthora kernoviae]RLN81459.1 hypothetical protein BBO99_00003708 [Phytophthora kernoviae]
MISLIQAQLELCEAEAATLCTCGAKDFMQHRKQQQRARGTTSEAKQAANDSTTDTPKLHRSLWRKLLGMGPNELSTETLAALQAHLLSRHEEEEEETVSEDFRLSQFWYDETTGRALAQEAIDHSSSELKIAFVSTPAAYRDFLKIQKEEQDADKRAIMGDNVYIFEYDRRFGEKYGDRFAFYDYNSPTDLPDKFHHFFDYVLMEPPHLSPDCLAKFSDTMRWLVKDVEKVPGKKDRVVNPSTFINSQLLCKEMKADLGFTPTGFKPTFASKLSNHLLTYTNYESRRFGPSQEPDDED